MSLIYIPTISSHKLNQAQFQNKPAPGFPGLSIGEILEAGVIEKAGDKNILITLKGVTIPADSEVALNAGDRIRVKVESLHPQVILRVVDIAGSEESRVTDYLKLYRANPEALSQMIAETTVLFNTVNLGKILRYLPEEDFQKILKLLKMLVMSPETKGKNFIKDYTGNLGLLMESQLRKLVEGGSGEGGSAFPPQSLKDLLVKLSGDIDNLLAKKETLGHEEVIKLTRLSEHVNASIKTIESHQIINFLLQETEATYLFQVPVFFPDGIRKSEIFIEYDRGADGKDRDKASYRVVIFLDMDILGDMIIEAGLRGEKIDCIIKCINQEICDLVSAFMDELHRSLLAAGCEINTMKCVAGNDLVKEKADYYRERVLYAREVIDLFA